MFKVPEWESDIPKSNANFAKKVKNIKSTKTAEIIAPEPVHIPDAQINTKIKEKEKHERIKNKNVGVKKKKPAKKRKQNDYVRRVINDNDIVLNKSELRELDEVIISAKKCKLQKQYEKEMCEDQLFEDKEENVDKIQTKKDVKNKKSKKNNESLKITNGGGLNPMVKSKMLNVASKNNTSSENNDVDSMDHKSKKKHNKLKNKTEKSKSINVNGDVLLQAAKSKKRKHINDENSQNDVEQAPVKAKKIKFEEDNQEQLVQQTGNEKKLNYKKKEKFMKVLAVKEQMNRNSISVKGDKLRERMMDRLKAAQFRYLNEKLYTSSGDEAQKIFQADPKAFRTYHLGYQQQVKKWPVNPLDVIVKQILKMPKSFLIADMGCGEASLSRRVPHSVRSFDLVSSAPGVEACDMAHTPLARESVDVAVYCLALMGTELTQYLVEANRVLKNGGQLLIAEVESRFDNVDDFVKEVERLGFKVKTVDKQHKVFFFLHFVKTRDPPAKKQKLPALQLKPCLYKKR